MSAHTPGPWHVAACPEHTIESEHVCVQVRKANGRALEPTVADLYLHAAAPDLLSACEAIVALLGHGEAAAAVDFYDGEGGTDARLNLESAIAKARGAA